MDDEERRAISLARFEELLAKRVDPVERETPAPAAVPMSIDELEPVIFGDAIELDADLRAPEAPAFAPPIAPDDLARRWARRGRVTSPQTIASATPATLPTSATLAPTSDPPVPAWLSSRRGPR